MPAWNSPWILVPKNDQGQKQSFFLMAEPEVREDSEQLIVHVKSLDHFYSTIQQSTINICTSHLYMSLYIMTIQGKNQES